MLGFPCNQFGAQEPGSEAQIKTFCETRFAVTFPLFAKLEVNGAGRHPLYGFLTSQSTQPDGPGDIQWNFAKFLVDKNGQASWRASRRRSRRRHPSWCKRSSAIVKRVKREA